MASSSLLNYRRVQTRALPAEVNDLPMAIQVWQSLKQNVALLIPNSVFFPISCAKVIHFSLVVKQVELIFFIGL